LVTSYMHKVNAPYNPSPFFPIESYSESIQIMSITIICTFILQHLTIKTYFKAQCH